MLGHQTRNMQTLLNDLGIRTKATAASTTICRSRPRNPLAVVLRHEATDLGPNPGAHHLDWGKASLRLPPTLDTEVRSATQSWARR